MWNMIQEHVKDLKLLKLWSAFANANPKFYKISEEYMY